MKVTMLGNETTILVFWINFVLVINSYSEGSTLMMKMVDYRHYRHKLMTEFSVSIQVPCREIDRLSI